MERAIILPFSIDASGSILSSNDPRNIWQSRVASAVLTELGERVFRPDYGGRIRHSIFEQASDAANIAAASVREVFGLYLKSLVLNDVQVDLNQQDGILSLTIDYTLPNQEKAQSVLRTGVLNRTGDVIQEY
jgi:phage baseplate assembly protein W